MTRQPVVAIAHDYLTQRGGGERVALAMLRAFPGSSLYTTLYDPEATYPEFAEHHIVTSPLNLVGPLRRDHRKALPFLAKAASAMTIDADVVLTSSSGWAHGMRTTGRMVVYCHSPARWLYQSETYLGGPVRASVKGWALAALRPYLRAWDQRAAHHGAPTYLVNSRLIAERVADTYGILPEVVHPPHSMDARAPQVAHPALADWADEGFHIIVSRLLPYKNAHQAIEAFRGMPGERLVVVGDGPMRAELTASLPRNVRMVQDITDAQLRWAYAHSVGLVAPSFEDFGLTPLEAAAFGKPAVTLGTGGYLDTIIEGVTGLYFDTPTPNAIRAAVLHARDLHWDSVKIETHADSFSEGAFASRLHNIVAHEVGARLAA